MDRMLTREIKEAIHLEVESHVGKNYLPPLLDQPSAFQKLVEEIKDDLYAYELRDPASRGNPRLILNQYPTFRAVLLYRIANVSITSLESTDRMGQTIAHRLSASSRLRTGIEIHPSARIGARFVIDHGWGTIVGETTTIGEDCYILGGVTLGALGISNNPEGKRHPTIGNRVQIGGHARILGNITVGDDCFVGPYTVVTQNVDANSRVLIVNQLQFVKGSEKSPDRLTIQGIVRLGERLVLQASGVDDPVASIVSEDGIHLLSLAVHPHHEDPNIFILESPPAAFQHLLKERRRLHLLIEDRGRHVLTTDLCRLFQHASIEPPKIDYVSPPPLGILYARSAIPSPTESAGTVI